MSALTPLVGQWVVVKLGGELAKDKAALAAGVGSSIRTLFEAGVKVAVIHGGGPQINTLSAKLGLETRQVGGRRVTDEATLEVLKMTLAGQVSVDIASAFRLARIPAICTTGVSAGWVDAVKRPPRVIAGAGPEPVDLGLVGDVTRVNVSLFETFASARLVPVVGCLCGDAEGRVYNVNADTVATRFAAQLRAAKLFLVSNVPGVLRDIKDPASRIPVLTPAEAKAQMAAGVIQGGMIPKVEESLAMLDEGIGAIHIIGQQPPDALLREAESAGSAGTAFVRA